MSVDDAKSLLVGTDNLPAPTIQEYLSSGRCVSDLPARVWSDVHMMKGVGQTFVQEQDNTLYHYDSHPLFRVVSRGGRLIVCISKVLLPMSKSRRKILRQRFLHLDTDTDSSLAGHLDRLVDQTDPRYLPPVSDEFSKGEFRLFMPDMRSPFVQIGTTDEQPLVVPLALIQSMAEIGLRPRCSLRYSNQVLLSGHNDDHTVRLMYSAHLMDNTLFRPGWM